VLIVSVIVAFSLNALNTWYYAQTPGWSDFYSENARKAEFTDFKKFSKRTLRNADLSQTAYSLTDIRLLNHWFLDRRELLAEDKMEGLRQETTPETQASFLSQLALASTRLSAQFTDRQSFYLTGLLFVLLFLFRFSWQNLILLGVTTVTLLTLAMGMLIFLNRLPDRVITPMTATVFFLAILLCGELRVKFKGKAQLVWNSFLGCALVAFASYGLKSHWQINQTKVRWRSDTRSLIAELNPDPNSLYVVWGNGFPYQALWPFEDFRSLFKDFHILQLGSSSLTPYYQEMKTQFGIQDLVEAFIKNDNMYLWATKPDRLQMLNVSAQERFGTALEFEPVFTHAGIVRLYKVVAKSTLPH
jgi:hypothetical protein